jgi:hypothetical protein
LRSLATTVFFAGQVEASKGAADSRLTHFERSPLAQQLAQLFGSGIVVSREFSSDHLKVLVSELRGMAAAVRARREVIALTMQPKHFLNESRAYGKQRGDLIDATFAAFISLDYFLT